MSLRNTQRGSVMVYALVIVGVLLAVNFALLRIFLPKVRVVRQSVNTMVAIYTADSVLEWCIYESRKGDIAPPAMNNGATYRLARLVNGDIITNQYNSDGTGNANVCPLDNQLAHTARGTYLGVTRSFEVGEATTP